MTKPIPGPDPNPKRPALRAPPGACDSHMHIFGPASRYPYDPDRNYTPPDALFEHYVRLMDMLGLERAVIVQPSVYGIDNDCTADSIARLQGRARGVAVVRPDASIQELRRLHDTGFRGVRFNLVHAGGSRPIDELEQLAGRVADLGWHVQVYLRGPVLLDIHERLRKMPATLVVDHMGHMDYKQGIDQRPFVILRELLASGRCWVKLSGAYRFDLNGPPYPAAVPFAQALVKTNPDRLVWATDWPHVDIPSPGLARNGPMPNDGDLLDALLDWAPDEAVREKILVTNPARLYDFGQVGPTQRR